MSEVDLGISLDFAALNLHVPPVDHHYFSSELSSDEASDGEHEQPPPFSVADDCEEGEISDDGLPPANPKKRLSNVKRHNRRRKAEKGKKEAVEHEINKMKPLLAAIYGVTVDHMHIHLVQRRPYFLRKLQEREIQKMAPLERSDVDEIAPDAVWIHEPGVHIGYMSEDGSTTPTIVLVVKIAAWEDMVDGRRAADQETLQVLMDWCEVAAPITNNAASKTPAHGVRANGEAAPSVRHGQMFAVGWHQSMEKGKTLVTYAPKNSNLETIKNYETLYKKLPQVANLYRDRLSRLFPGGSDSLQNTAHRDGVLSFADTLDGSDGFLFANSLTVTRQCFSNYQHRDKDHHPVASGIWWEASNVQNHWTFSPDVDHSKTSGGEFYWGEFGIGVDFPRIKGLVEIFWRGMIDFHGTLQSTDVSGFTRFGTSIQLTAKGVNAMKNVWNVNELAASGHDIHKLNAKSAVKITTLKDRLDNAAAKPHKKKARR